MANMGRYCKAYLLTSFRQFPGWSERAASARQEETRNADDVTQMKPRELSDDSVLYLQENYVVTDGIFLDENVIFGNVSDEWKKFCMESLGFSIPDYVEKMSDLDARENSGEKPGAKKSVAASTTAS